MYLQKTELVICLGSSCFARGNKQLVKIVKEYLKVNNLEEDVYFHGNHCFDECQKGPLFKVNENLYTEVDENKIVEILNKHFKI